MTRLLGLVVLAVLIWLVLEALLARARGSLGGGGWRGAMPRQGVRRGTGKRQGQEGAAEVLVRCGGCGIYVPRSRVVGTDGGGGEAYCSERCLERSRSAAPVA